MKYILSIGSFLLVITAIVFFVPLFTDSEIGFSRLNGNERTAISATAATVSGTFSGVSDYNLIGFTVTALAASGTVKFPCSMSDEAPSLLSVPSASNRYAYAEVIDLESGATIDGNTGLVFPVTTTVRHLAIQNSVYKHCTAIYLQGAANTGSTTVRILPTTNQ